MQSAYLNQLINVIVTVLLVPILLHHLDIADFVIWAIFTAFGGIALQFESAIQIVTVRDIAREQKSSSASSLLVAVAHARRAYRFLALGALMLMLPIGWLYLDYVASARLGGAHLTEWTLFVASYALNFYCGWNNSALLGCGRVALFNNINSVTRLVNLGLTALFLSLGFSLLGVCASFALSVVLSCISNAVAARSALALQGSRVKSGTRDSAPGPQSMLMNIARYTAYTLASFLVFRGSVLVGAALFTSEVMGTYSLTLQTFAMLTMLAAVPVQVWLARLVKAMASGDSKEVVREARRTIVAANSVYLLALLGAAVAGNPLLAMIGSDISLLTGGQFLLVGLAFLVELNIFLLVTFLVTSRNYRFVVPYVGAVAIALLVASIAAAQTRFLVSSLVAVPLLIQSAVTLPIVFRLFCLQLGMSRASFMSEASQIFQKRR